ncbi:MAG TPA: hypothetical protein PLL69_04310, partial [Gemmatimonadales bacterium]|nr:hypothetical protein [Gemmatimonadales bacterium]
MKLRGPKGRIARRLGIAISPKTARIIERRQTPPGQHGASRRPGKTSEYHKQLLEKQRLRAQYGISESQLRALYRKATRLRGNTGERLIQLLERRLDAVILRSGAEMRSLFSRFPGALERTVEITQDLAFPLRKASPRLPKPAVPEGHTPMTWLRELIRRGAQRLYADAPDSTFQRLEKELAVIKDKDFPGYFLIVHD